MCPDIQPEKRPPQHQEHQPGIQRAMTPEPQVIRDNYRGSDKLHGKVALITGGDSGIGRSVAVHFAREGADVLIGYLEEDRDAEETKRLVEEEGRRCELMRGDVGDHDFCRQLVQETVSRFGRLDVLVSNAAEQHICEQLEDIRDEQLHRTFRSNFFPYVYLTKEAVPHMEPGSSIIATGSITAYQGHSLLMDYAATKGAIESFTFSLAQSLASRGIRVNGVAPGPIWTPLIPASFSAEQVEEFGTSTLMKRPGQPAEVAPAYVFLASEDASFVTGQFIHVNGGSYMA